MTIFFSTFNESNVYQNLDKGPIIEDTILVLDPHTGSVLHSWGAYAFYMPHGLTVDHHDNVWVTDVAKHQVFKVCFIIIFSVALFMSNVLVRVHG